MIDNERELKSARVHLARIMKLALLVFVALPLSISLIATNPYLIYLCPFGIIKLVLLVFVTLPLSIILIATIPDLGHQNFWTS